MPFPFEVPYEEVERNIDEYIDIVCASLESNFLTMPRGEGFVEYGVFNEGYENLKRATNNFRNFNEDALNEAITEIPISLIVLRTILGFTPPQFAHVTEEKTGVSVPQTAARSLDRNIRFAPLTALNQRNGVDRRRIGAMVSTACYLLEEGAPDSPPEILHRLDKADTKFGISSVQSLADLGVPYSMVLYERFLGRPFASHRDSVSDLIGDVLESAIEGILIRAGISYRRTRRAERIAGFDQAPDFFIPDEFAPKIVIEAKITEDDGTARDKVTRVQHLYELSMQGADSVNDQRFEVIACIDGRGFKIRRSDMKKLLISTRGNLFTSKTLEQLVPCTRLSEFQTIF